MKYIGITEERPIEQENRLITALLDNGLDLIHLRKPKYSGEKTEQLLLSIPPRYYARIVLHDHFELAEKYRNRQTVALVFPKNRERDPDMLALVAEARMIARQMPD